MFCNNKYTEIPTNWDDEIKDCCKTTPPGDSKCDDCCYDTWQDELNQISSSYNIAVENSQQLQNKYDFVIGRRNRYKSWLDELDKAETMARDICDQLKLIAVQSNRIWYNACEAVKAIEILYCMIIDILNQADELKKFCNDLDNCIARNTDPALDGQGIQKYYTDYKSKLDAVTKTRDDIIKNLIDAVVIANEITNGIFSRDCKCKDNPKFEPCNMDVDPCAPVNDKYYYGLKTVICEWYTFFACATPCPPIPDCPPTQQGQQNQQNQQSNQGQQTQQTPTQNDCEDDCGLEPNFDFPICKNTYRADVQKWVNADTKQLGDLTIDLQKSRIKREGLLACKNSLDSAIKAVNPKERCK